MVWENVFNPEKAKVKLLPLEDTPIPNDNGNKKGNNTGVFDLDNSRQLSRFAC